MSLIPVDVGGVTEPKPVPNGRYDLTILSAEEGVTKEKKKPQIVVYVGIDAHPDAPNIRHNVMIPQKDDNDKAREFKKLLLARFLKAFNVPHDGNGFDTEDFIGCKANLSVILGEPQEGSGRQYNEIELPPLPDAGAAPKGGAAKPPSQKR